MSLFTLLGLGGPFLEFIVYNNMITMGTENRTKPDESQPKLFWKGCLIFGRAVLIILNSLSPVIHKIQPNAYLPVELSLFVMHLYL